MHVNVVDSNPLVEFDAIIENTWINIAPYAGKKIVYEIDPAADSNVFVEFSDDGINPLPDIKRMDLNPTTWDNGDSGVEHFWTTNFTAKYIRFPDITPCASIKLYGSLGKIERDYPVIIEEGSYIMVDDSVPALQEHIIGEEQAYDPFVRRVTIDADGGDDYVGTKNIILLVERSGPRAAGNKWVMHQGPFFLNPHPHVVVDGSAAAAGVVLTVGKGTQFAIGHSDKIIINVNAFTATSVTVEVSNDSGLTYQTINVKDLSDGTYKAIASAGVYVLEGTFMAVRLTQVGVGNTALTMSILASATPFGLSAVQSVDLGRWGGAIGIKNLSHATPITVYTHKYY